MLQKLFGPKVYFDCGAARKKNKCPKKEGKERAALIFALLQKKECHSHIAPSDKKEWHSSFAPNFGSGAWERRSKECRSLTHWKTALIFSAVHVLLSR